MLSTQDFKDFAKQYVVFAHVTTHLDGRAHEQLLTEKGFNSFPTLAAMDPDGTIIARLGGDRDVAGFRKMMATASRYMEVRDAETRSPEDELWLLHREVELGTVDPVAGRARLAALEDVPASERTQLERRLVDMEIVAVLGKPASEEEARELFAKAGPIYARMWAEGKEPLDEELVQPFFILMLDHAERERDVDLFERALGRLRDQFGEVPDARPFFEAQTARLAKLKAAAAGAADGDGDGEGEGEGEGGDG